MRPGDRVDTIRRLVPRLTRETWPEMDFVLGQFKAAVFETDWNYEGDQVTYAREVLERASDSVLGELNDYFFGGAAGDRLDATQLPWDADMLRLFMSHTAQHAKLAGGISDVLRPWRVHAFVAHQSIKPTREWERVIEAALDTADAGSALITDDFLKSKWCDQEVGWLRARKVPIVPVKLGKEDPHGFINKFQAAVPERTDRAPWVADAIFRALADNPAIARQMARPVVYRCSLSTNDEGAVLNWGLVERIPEDAWTPELIEIVERAPTDNPRVQGAVVPGTGQSVPDAADDVLAPIRTKLGLDAAVRAVPASADDDIPF
jgi:hypothetical protein